MTQKRPQFINLLAKKFASQALHTPQKPHAVVDTLASHVLDHITDFIVFINRAGQVVYVNAAMLRFLGPKSEASLLKKGYREVFPSPGEGADISLSDAVERVLGEQKPFVGEILWGTAKTRCAARVLPLEGGAEVILTPLDPALQALGLGPARGEIGDPKILADLGRELQNVVQSVLGASEFLMSPDQTELDRIETVRNIRGQVARLSRMAVDLSELSVLAQGPAKLHGITLPMDAFFDQMMTEWTYLTKERNLGFALSSSTPLPSHFLTDPLRFKQILWDILAFLVANNESGGIDVRVAYAPGQDATPGRMTFLLRDHLPGQPDHETWISEKVPASGLASRELGSLEGLGGLWMRVARMILRAMKGDLSVLSASGLGDAGTRPPKIVGFSVEWEISEHSRGDIFLLEDAAKAKSRTAGMLPARRPLEGAQVLLVEDSPDSQVGISRMLRVVGAEVRVVATGLEGLEYALAGAWHVILLDTEIGGGIDGYEMVRHLRQAGYDLPIVALAAKPSSSERRRVLASGFDAYLPKPIDRYMLIEVLAEQLIRSGRSSLSPSSELPPSDLLH